ncbi:MAG: Nramp family divalent metal transporter [Pirellulales bacterium]
MSSEVRSDEGAVASFPQGALPPLRVRDLPEPVPLRRMIGPSIMLAGLALGSGEFVFWPYITYKIGFTFIWACLVGVITQYFLNMEITRWCWPREKARSPASHG